MTTHTITLNDLDLSITYSVKDDSPRGCHTVSGTQLKTGDKVLIDNYFHEIIEEAPAENENNATVTTLDLLDDLNPGDYGDRLNDYRGDDGYICDIIAEIADDTTSIYYSDILEFVKRNPEALNDVIAEGVYYPDKNYNFWEHARAAEYITIERDIHDNLADSLMVAAVNYIHYDLNRKKIPGELAELLRDWCDESDICDRINEIPDKINEYFEEGANAAFETFCGAQNCDTCKYCDCTTTDECRARFTEENADND